MTRNLLLVAGLALVGTASAQDHSVLFCMDGNEITLDNAGGLVEAGLIREDEAAIVTPAPGSYSASIFMSMSSQWAYIGDLDLDDRLVDSSTAGPGDDTDAIFLKRFPTAPVGTIGPRDLYFSKEGTAGFATGFEDGDVFRYVSQGAIELFITEVQLLEALGQTPTSDVDLDSICQSADGDLFVSFDLTETTPTGSADDGAIVMIPAGAITYDGNDNVAAVVASSAQIIAAETDVNTWIANSLMLTSVGGAPSTSIDVTAMDIDPAGGTFESPQIPGLFLPNLLFAWSGFSNDGAILSTAGGGSIATINGQPMASTVATTGLQIGLLPDSTGLGGLMGLSVIPARAHPFAVENYPTNLITSSTILYTRQEVSGAAPGGAVVFFVMLGPTATGSALPETTVPPLGGAIYGLLSPPPTILGLDLADGGGYASFDFLMPSTLVGTGINLAFQVYDAALFSFGAPAPMQFL